MFLMPITAWTMPRSGYEMYHCDGEMPQGRAFSNWERRNCPWYMEANGWNSYENDAERTATAALAQQSKPADTYKIGKLQNVKDSVVELFETTICWEPKYDGKTARI